MAIAATNIEVTVMGNKRVLFADLTGVADGLTYVTEFQNIVNVDFIKTTAAAGTDVGATVSGGTITFKVESGTLAGKLMVVGT